MLFSKLAFAPPPLLQPALPNTGTLPQAGKFGKRPPDAAFIPKQSHVCRVSTRAVLCHGTHLSRENCNSSVSNTLNGFPASRLPHLLLSAHFDLFQPLCLQGHHQNCSITASSLRWSSASSVSNSASSRKRRARSLSSSAVPPFLWKHAQPLRGALK